MADEEHIDFKDIFKSEVKHPSRSAYQYGCRHPDCIAENTKYHQKYRKKRAHASYMPHAVV